MSMEPANLAALEPNQISSATRAPLPPRALGPGVRALLIAMRIYVLIAIPLVAYAFVHALMTPQ